MSALRGISILLQNTASSIVEGGNINFGSVTTFVSNTSTGSNINLLTNY